MARKSQKDIEKEQASAAVSQWESQNGALDDNQRATLQRMIELKSNTAEQDIRRSDYYNGGSYKYEKNVQPVQVRNENTNRLVKQNKETFSLREGQSDVTPDRLYQNGEFETTKLNNLINNLRNAAPNPVQVDEVKTTEQRMQDKSADTKTNEPKKNSFLDDVGFTLKNSLKMGVFRNQNTANQVGVDIAKRINDNPESEKNLSEIARFGNRLTDSASLGIYGAGIKALGGEDIVKDWQKPREGLGNNVADAVSTGLGYLVPGAAATKSVQTLGMGAKIGEGASLGTKALQYAKEGAATGALLGAAETPARAYTNPEEKITDHMKRIGMDASLGAGGDLAFRGGAEGLTKVIQALNKDKAVQQIANIIPPKGEPLRANLPETTPQLSDMKINGAYEPQSNAIDTLVQKLNPEAAASVMKPKEQLPVEKVVSPLNKAKLDAQNEFAQAVDKQYEYLKSGTGKGVEPGNVIRDVTGEVVDRYGRISNNPTWYQEWYKANGRKPNNAEIRQLAEQHVRNGYKENGVDIPSWGPSSVKNIDNQIDEMTKMMESMPQEKEAFQPLLEGLHKERQKAIESFYTKLDGNPTIPNNGSLPEGVQAMRNAAPVLQTATKTDGQTITHQQLLDSIKKNLGAEIRTGRMGVSDDAVQGIYKTNPEVIRTKDYGDLETISHEIGHHFDKKFGLNNSQFDDELMKLGAHTSAPDYTPEQIRQEGIAEYMRRYLLNPQVAQQDAPKFAQHFQSVIPEKMQKGLQKVQGDVQVWANQGDEARFSGKIANYEKPKGLERIKQLFKNAPQTSEKLYTEGIDRLFPIAKAEKEILGGNLADASQSMYKRARLAAGTPRIAEQKLDELRNILKPLDASQYKLQDIRDYMTAVHAQDLEKQGIKTGFTPEEIQSTLKKYENSNEMKGMQQAVVKYNNSLLDKLVESQVLSKDSVEAMRAKHPNYVPFFRHFDEEATAGLGGKGFVDLTNPVKRMTGSSRNVINPLESMIKNTFAVTQAAEKNKVGLELARLAEQPGSGKWIEKLDGKESVRNENIVTVFQNGEKVQYQLAPELYSAVKSLDKEVTNKFILALGKPSDWLRAGATLTPEFALRNPIRDQFNAIVTSDTGYNPLDFIKGLKEVGKKNFGKSSPVYDDWVKQGGAYGGYLSSDRNLLNEQLSSFSKEGTGLQRAIQTLKSPKDWLKPLQKLSEISEEATKVGAYQKGLKKGLTPEESAYQARDLMDFNRTGNAMQSANRILTFLNANVQGKDKLIRSFKENPVRTASRLAGTTLPPTALAYASYQAANDKQKEVMDNMPQWERDTYWAFAVPGTDEVARIPKPFDMSLLANTAERAAKYAQGDKYAFEGYGNTVNDVVKMPFIPTVLQPVVENMTNHSFFTDGPIVPQRDQSNSPRNQYGPTTSETAKLIGDKLNVSPYKVDNLYKGYTAGLGQYPLQGLDKVIAAISNKDVPTKPAKSFTESAPGIRAFFSNDMGGGKAMDDYFNVSEQQKAIEADAKDNGQEPPNKAEMKTFNKLNKQMSELRQEYRQVQQDTQLSPSDKRDEMDRLNREMRDLARQGIQIFRPDYK